MTHPVTTYIQRTRIGRLFVIRFTGDDGKPMWALWQKIKPGVIRHIADSTDGWLREDSQEDENDIDDWLSSAYAETCVQDEDVLRTTIALTGGLPCRKRPRTR